MVDYLSKVSPDFKKTVGVATSVNWPVGVGGKGNEGVAGLVKQTPGSIGYVELVYAKQNKIDYGSVQNFDGEFVSATLDSVTAAAAAAAKAMPKDFRVSITNAPGKGAYPISSFTWLLYYEKPSDKKKAKIMVDFMKWALTEGQKYTEGPRLRAAAPGGRRAGNGSPEAHLALAARETSIMKTPSSRRSADDRGFRLGTGFFALLVVLLVAGIFWELFRTSHLSIAKFGFKFWTGKTWDPVSGEFGALPFIWGTLYSSLLAMLISTPIALGIAIFLSELSPKALRTPLAFLTELLAAIPSIVYGLWGVFVLVPLVRQLQVATPDWMRKIPLFSGPPLGVGMGAAALILAVMVIPFTSSVAREVLKAVPYTQREAGLRPRRDALGGHPGGAALRARRASSAPSSSASDARSARRWR